MLKVKKFTRFIPKIKSRHPSHDVLRGELGLFPFKSIIRLGSITQIGDEVSLGGNRIEINSVESIRNSSNKLLMKQCFTKADVKTSNWFILGGYNSGLFLNMSQSEGSNNVTIDNLPYPIIAKHIYGSRGTGNTLLNNQQQLEEWLVNKNPNNYIFEKYYNYNREYRLHVTNNGCFYTCRKVLKEDTPQDKRWYRNDSNCNWLIENNPGFDKPVNWNTIVYECIKALNAVGLDIGGFDVKVQSARKDNGNLRENPKFIIIESNSACSFGEITSEKYKEELSNLLIDKYNKYLGIKSI